jgi:RimJ/RimL family protein N-acetyltransferase
VIRPENTRSIRLAERLSATLERETGRAGKPLLVYGLVKQPNAKPGIV